jgi:flagellar protein FlaF
MFMSSYAEVQEDSPYEKRSIEYDAIGKSIDDLKAASDLGAKSPEAERAFVYTAKLWRLLLDDMVDASCELPDELRGRLISLGLWIMKEIGRLRDGTAISFDDLIDISVTIREGLK